MKSIGFLENLAQDTRYASRTFRKNPGFVAMAALTLALGIGASAAVFSVVHAVLLKPLPFPRPQKIVLVDRIVPRSVVAGLDAYPWERPSFLLFARESKTFQALGAFKSDSFNMTGSGEPARLDGIRASSGFFSTLGVAPALGRAFTAEEDTPGHEHEVVLSHQLWLDRFGADPHIVGRAIDLNGSPYTVTGVMPAGFTFPRAEEMPRAFSLPAVPQLWVPLALQVGPVIPAEEADLAVMGRVNEGVAFSQVQSEMDVLAKRMEEQIPQAKGWFNSRPLPLAEQVAGNTRRPLLLVFGAVGVVLLIACSNVANLLLTRSIGRAREFTVRSALGAGQGRLIRQLLTESVWLAGTGSVAGIALAQAGISFLKTFGPSSIPRLREVTLDPQVFLFVFATTLFTGILFGLAPALGAARTNLAGSLKQGIRGGSAGTPILRKVLMVSQVALALVLVVAAGLLTKTFFHLLSVDPGFSAERVLTFELTLPATKYPDQTRIVQLYEKVRTRLLSLPGVEGAGIVETVPMGGVTESTGIRIPGFPPAERGHPRIANYTMISPGYFAAVKTPILQGREFLESDTASSQPVTIINSIMAKQYWPRGDALGKQVGPGSSTYPAGVIVGIVADVKHVALRENPVPEMYVPYTNKVWPSLLTMDVVLRSRADPASLTASVRESIHSVDPDLPLANVRTLSAIVRDSMAQPRFAVLLIGSFGLLAILLASIGMYGVISYSVMQRTQEIGIRMALGAQRTTIFGMVLGQGLRLTVLGIILGLLAALGVTRLMTSFLYGVAPSDPFTFAAVSGLLIAVAALACYLPARHATKVDPMVALRCE